MLIAEAERRLRADYDILAPHRFYCPAEHFLGAIRRGSVEQIDTKIERPPDDRDRVGQKVERFLVVAATDGG